MVARGRVQNGVVVLTDGVCLPEGQEVTVVAPLLPNSKAHGILDIPPVSLGAVVRSFTADDERRGDARLQPDPPIGELRVGIVGLHHVGEIDDRPSRGAEGVGEPLHIGNGTHEKRHVDPHLGCFPRDMCEAALGMDEIVLHIHDNQC